MEKNTCLALPVDNGRFELHHSTQMPDGARGYIANAAGVTEEKIQIICRRLGGAFGGKATKNIPIGMAATLCAKKLRKPVKLVNSIGQDMMMYGNARHPMIAKYTIAADRNTGKIKAMDVTTYVVAGCSADFSDFIAGEMLENIESSTSRPTIGRLSTCCAPTPPATLPCGPQGCCKRLQSPRPCSTSWRRAWRWTKSRSA